MKKNLLFENTFIFSHELFGWWCERACALSISVSAARELVNFSILWHLRWWSEKLCSKGKQYSSIIDNRNTYSCRVTFVFDLGVHCGTDQHSPCPTAVHQFTGCDCCQMVDRPFLPILNFEIEFKHRCNVALGKMFFSIISLVRDMVHIVYLEDIILTDEDILWIYRISLHKNIILVKICSFTVSYVKSEMKHKTAFSNIVANIFFHSLFAICAGIFVFSNMLQPFFSVDFFSSLIQNE